MITGGGSGQHDLAWMRRQVGQGERVRITERTGSLFALGLWGPNAREVLSAVTDVDVGNDAFPYMTARYLNVGEVGPVWAQRISYAGELGWELYGQFAMGDGPGGCCGRRQRPRGSWPPGSGARHAEAGEGLSVLGQDITHRARSLPGRARLRVKMDKEEFQARGARAGVGAGPREKLACITLDDRSAVVLGEEPIRSGGQVVGYVTSAGYGYGRALHRLRLPARRAGGAGHGGRGRVLRRAAPGDDRRGPAVGPEGRTTEGVTRSAQADHAWKERSLAIIDNPGILLYTRIRKSPYYYASREHGVARYSVYNHTFHPRHYGDPAEYWHRERRHAGTSVSRSRSRSRAGRVRPHEHDRLPRPQQVRGRRVQVRLHHRPDGGILNDPVLLRVAEDEFWLSLADSDVNLYALGIAREGDGRHRAGDRRGSRPDPGAEREEGAGGPVRRAGPRDPVLRPDEGELDGMDVSCTGYTGEVGYEIYLRDASEHGVRCGTASSRRASRTGSR